MKDKLGIIMTAGGTIENIDNVRSIGNTSTGKLGCCICKEIIQYMKSHNINDYIINYVISKTAIRPELTENEKKYVVFYEVTSTVNVKDRVAYLLDTYAIHYFVHSMAVSDFTPTKAITIKNIAKDIRSQIVNDGLENIEEIIEKALREPQWPVYQNKKMSSKEDIVLLLEQTPKIISLIKQKAPELFLVGFKLLNNVSEEELLQAANSLGMKNNCDLVLANDLKTIKAGKHEGLLVKDGAIIQRLLGKKAIAQGLVEEMFKNVHKI
jgi:phosphopantothenate-cysteine ligase